MKHTRILVISTAALVLTACGRNPDYPQQNGQAPQQAPQGDNGLLWGLGGFLLGRATAPTPQVGQQAPVYQQDNRAYQPQYQAPAAPAVTPAIGSAVQPVAPTKPAVQLPQVKPADKPPVYAGPSGYSSVTQAAPTFKLPPAKSVPTPVTPVTPPAPAPVAKSVPTPAPAPKPAVSYSFKPAPAPAPTYRAPAPAPRPAPAPARSK